jgi:hypothetical protein
MPWKCAAELRHRPIHIAADRERRRVATRPCTPELCSRAVVVRTSAASVSRGNGGAPWVAVRTLGCPTSWTPLVRSVPAAVLLVVALALSACASDPSATVEGLPGSDGAATAAPTESESAAGAEQEASDSASEGEVAGDAPAPAPSPASSGASPETSPTPAPAVAPASASGGPLSPIPAGTYSYDTDGETQLGVNPAEPMPKRTTLEASVAGSSDRQDLARDLRHPDGRGSRNTLHLQYGVEGVVLHGATTSTTVEVFGNQITNGGPLVAMPPTVIAPVGAAPGDVAKVRLEGDGVIADVRIELLRRETLTIGGEDVEVLVAQVDYTFSGEIEGKSTVTWWVRPDDLLTVREESALDVTSQGSRYQESHTSQLRSLRAA